MGDLGSRLRDCGSRVVGRWSGEDEGMKSMVEGRRWKRVIGSRFGCGETGGAFRMFSVEN